MKKILFFLLACLSMAVQAQLHNDDVWKTSMFKGNIREVIHIPDVEGYKTLKCDFHSHTLYSDGLVWPRVRVNEAWLQGLDAIAITDHIEVRPRKDNVLGDLNESYKIAAREGENLGIIVIKGIEITRSKPFGHINALFITDAEPLNIKDSIAAIDIARAQRAVIMWNHPGWPDDKSTFYDVHKKLIDEHKIDMVEVHNGAEYYPKVFEWVNKYDLAPSANSDIHNEIYYFYGTEKAARPMTLVFAENRSADAIKDAILSKRTAAVFDGNIMATEKWAKALFLSSIRYTVCSHTDKSAVVEIENISDLPFVMQKPGGNTLLVPPGKIYRTTTEYPSLFKVLNIYVGLHENLEVVLPVE